MRYTFSTSIAGSPESAIKVLGDVLISNDFQIEEAKQSRLTATGPGLRSTNQNPIQGISRATFRAENGSLHVQAELGGVRWLGRFAMIFPISLGLLLSLTFWLVSIFQGGDAAPASMVIPILAVAPWLVVGPLLARLIRKRTEKAILRLMRNAASFRIQGVASRQDSR